VGKVGKKSVEVRREALRTEQSRERSEKDPSENKTKFRAQFVGLGTAFAFGTYRE